MPPGSLGLDEYANLVKEKWWKVVTQVAGVKVLGYQTSEISANQIIERKLLVHSLFRLTPHGCALALLLAMPEFSGRAQKWRLLDVYCKHMLT